MNVFYLDDNPQTCAKYHNDKHVVKMILEYAQLLCSVHHLCGQTDASLYRLTHKNHPSAIWVRSSKSHYDWLYQLFVALCDEYTHRYGKVHLTWQKLGEKLAHCPSLGNLPFQAPPMVMPDECKKDNCILAYRHYYQTHKGELLRYTNREMPDWLS